MKASGVFARSGVARRQLQWVRIGSVEQWVDVITLRHGLTWCRHISATPGNIHLYSCTCISLPVRWRHRDVIDMSPRSRLSRDIWKRFIYRDAWISDLYIMLYI